MAVGTNAFVLTKRLENLLPYLTYLRVNFSAGKKRYAEIMGVKVISTVYAKI